MGFPGLGARCAADAALEGMLEAMAFEVAPFGVRVSVLQPGLGVVRVRQEMEVEEGLEAVRRVCGDETGDDEVLRGWRGLRGEGIRRLGWWWGRRWWKV